MIKKAIVLAAGEGTRLRPLTLSRPKHLIPLAGKPIIYWILKSLSKARIKEVGVIVNYKADMIKAYIEQLDFRLRYDFIYQRELNGTAGALEVAKDCIDFENFLLIYGDVITDTKNIVKMIDIFESKKLDGVVLGVRSSAPWEYGVIKMNNDGFMLEIIEKPPRGKEPSDVINGGVYVFTPKIIELLDSVKPSIRGEKELTDALQMLARRGKVYVYRAFKENWFDVGRPWDLLDANAYLLSRLGQKLSRKISNKRIIIRSPVYLGKNIEIGEGSIIGPNVAIYDNVKIGKFSEISNSIIMQGTKIGSNVSIKHSIVGENVVIGDNVRFLYTRGDKKTIKMYIKGREVDSGRFELGSVIGDRTRISSNCVLKAGTIIFNDIIV